MAKKRKTLQQKKLADLRHSFSHTLVNQVLPGIKLKSDSQLIIKAAPIEQNLTTNSVSAASYPYLIKDLSKTGILTATILAFQIILFFLLTNHRIVIPGLSY